MVLHQKSVGLTLGLLWNFTSLPGPPSFLDSDGRTGDSGPSTEEAISRWPCVVGTLVEGEMGASDFFCDLGRTPPSS